MRIKRILLVQNYPKYPKNLKSTTEELKIFNKYIMNTKRFFRLMAMVLMGTAMTMMTSCKKEEPSLANEWYFGK